jgi:2-oxoglutarate dehydrogenase complex dehydrogenase (E1) component-like enzyme
MEESFDFIFRVYPKQRAIQFKPIHDKHNHFSIIWTKEKALSKEDFEIIRQEIVDYLQHQSNKLPFIEFARTVRTGGLTTTLSL